MTTSGRRGALALFALLLGVYLATSSFRVDTIDSVVRLEVARSLVHRHDVDVPAYQLHTIYGRVGGIVGADGRSYGVYGLGQSLLLAPFVWLGGDHDAQLVTLVNPLATALTFAIFYLVALRLGSSERGSMRAALSCGLCTLAWPQSKLTFEAPLESLLLVTALYLLVRAPRLWSLALGAVIGFSVSCRPSAIVMIPGLAWCVYRNRATLMPRGRSVVNVIFVAAGALPFAVMTLWYNAYRWGGVLRSGYRYTDFAYFQWWPEGLYGLTLSVGRGFFWFSPVLVLAFWGWPRLRESSRGFAEALLGIALGYLLFFSFSTVWHGDWTWGPRHILPLVPVCGLAMLPMCEPGVVKRNVWQVLIVASIAVQVPALLVNYDAYYLRMLRMTPPRVAIDHFDTKSSQLGVQLGLTLRSLTALPESIRRVTETSLPQLYRSGMEGGEAPRLLLEPTPTPIPDLWWFYFPLVGVPAAVYAGVAAACLALIALGSRIVRRIVA